MVRERERECVRYARIVCEMLFPLRTLGRLACRAEEGRTQSRSSLGITYTSGDLGYTLGSLAIGVRRLLYYIQVLVS